MKGFGFYHAIMAKMNKLTANTFRKNRIYYFCQRAYYSIAFLNSRNGFWII